MRKKHSQKWQKTIYFDPGETKNNQFWLKNIGFLSKEQPDYNVEETKAASEFTVFNRAWHYIKQIDLNKEDHLSAIIQFNKDHFIPAHEAAINYFEDPDVEQYEMCAFLFKILDLKKQV